MTAHDIKKVSIRAYLADMGIKPGTEKPHYGMYHSPLREDTNPSFKVDYRENLWYDFGTGEGGSIIDLVMKLHKCDNHEAMRLLEKGNYPGAAT